MDIAVYSKDIIGYEGLYVICRSSKIWSCIYRKYLKGRVQGGYLRVGLYKDEVKKEFAVHRLVAIHFIPNPENKPCVHHKDGDKFNNSESNLEWVTEQENTIYSWKDGRSKHTASEKRRIATSMATRKFTKSQEEDIRELHKSGVMQKDIAESMGVCRQTVMTIVNKQHKVKHENWYSNNLIT